MVNFTFTNATATIGTTEYSLAKNATYSAGSPMTALACVTAVIDVSNMVAGDQYEIRVYERANAGTQRVLMFATLTGAQSEAYITPPVLLGDGWDVTMKRTAGADRSILFSVRQDTNDVGVVSIASGAITAAVFAANAITSAALASGAITAATFAANAITSTVVAAGAIGATQIGSAAITAAKFAADAIDAAALAASAVAEIQSGLASAATALSTTQWTNVRAALLDNLDAAVTTRAPASTALSTTQWTNVRAALLDNLNAAITTVASSVASTVVETGVSIVGGSLTLLGALRILTSIAVGKVTGRLTDAPKFRDVGDTKDRVVGATTTDGRTTSSVDPT